MTALWLLVALYTSSPNECRDVCEVLDMEPAGDEGCECICFDPVSKTRQRFIRPDCTRG